MKQFQRVHAAIDLDAIAANFEIMHRHLKPGTKICAVVKADCYGHGALQIARLVQEYDFIWGFACATATEAMHLRNGGIRKPILLLGYAFAEDYEDMIDYDIRACIFEKESAEAFAKCARMLGKTGLCHLALDTGMGRIGFQDRDESVETIREISRIDGLKIEGMFTHFARADEASQEPIYAQLERYQAFSEKLKKAGVEIPIHHASNSAGLMRCKDANCDMVRAGITMYGLMPSGEVASEMTELKPAMTLTSHVTFVKTLPKGCPISYGGTYVTERTTRVATVPVGYADGYPRSLSNKGFVLIHGTRVPIIGRICMDQFMVDVSSLDDVKAKDEVVLIGAQGQERITAEELGEISGRFNYELVCGFSKRVPRNYLKQNTVLEQVDYF